MGPPKSSAQSKVGEFYVTVFIDQYIVWLYVAMNKTEFVHALNEKSEEKSENCDVRVFN